MDFEFTANIYIPSEDLRKMYLLCKNNNYTPLEAMTAIVSGYDDCDYYSIGYVEDQIIEEINRRLNQTKNNKEKNKED